MERSNAPTEHIRFGAFELDLRSGELCKNGTKRKLQEQPFQILRILLENPGGVVTREELRKRIWPVDTFVDFDHGLYTAITKLREALHDSAEHPRFIETLSRRGYRFIAPVRGEAQKEPEKTTTGRNMALFGAIAILVATLVVGGFFWRPRRKQVLTEKDTVVLGDFANFTRDPALREGLSLQLEQSPFLNLLSEEGIHRALRMMEQPMNVRLTPEITREICQRTNSMTALEGSIALIGTRYNLILKAVNCDNGELLASTESQANDKSHVLDALSQAASEMRRKLGESLKTLQRYNTPLVRATTPSLEALKAYSLGANTLLHTGDFAASQPFFQRAIELDPSFAMAYLVMSDGYSVIGETASSSEYIRRAYELRAAVSDLERLLIEGDYYFMAIGDLMKTRRSFELCAMLYPRNAYVHQVLGASLNMLGQYQAGLSEYREALRLDPHNSFVHRDVVFTYLLLDRLELAVAAANEAHAKDADSDLAPVLYGIAFYRADTAEMARVAAAGAGKLRKEDLILALEADTAGYLGRLENARSFSRRAIASAKEAGEREIAADYYAASALREALLGETSKARQLATAAKRHSRGRDTYYGAALAFAYAGDASRAQALADDLANRYPEDTIVQFNYMPTLRAKLAISRSNPLQALDILAVATPYELGLPAYSYYNWPNLYPIYVRGEAYLAAHRGNEAAVEFQKILDHRGIVLNEPIGALAHLQLARAYALQGKTTKARGAYQDFLTLWKDADPDIPILKQAKAEYAKLP